MNDVVAYQGRTGLMSANDIRQQVNLVQEVMQAVMKEGTHFGKIPGTPKPSLWKPGAEVLCATFRIGVSYRVEDLSGDDVIRYRIVCVGTHQASGTVLGEGVGEASSDEEKYKWRKAAGIREFEATPANRRRLKFGYNREKREEYDTKQVRTEPADVANTILKMAAKRAQVAMTLNVTAASDIFTQDIEDLPEELQQHISEDEQRPPPLTPEQIAELKTEIGKATDRVQLREATKKALTVCATAKDAEAHGAIKAYATTLSLNLGEPIAAETPE
jgi:hypothetical protein